MQCIYILHNSENNPIISLKSITRLASVMELQYVLCVIGTNCLNIIWISCLKGLNIHSGIIKSYSMLQEVMDSVARTI
jgi:hypothetical protein